MDLLPEGMKKRWPPLYSRESSSSPIGYAKLFTPDATWTWFVTEGSQQEDEDWLLFGYVIGQEEKWGYFLLSEIANIRGPLRLPVERDLWFQSGPVDEVLRRERTPAPTAERSAK